MTLGHLNGTIAVVFSEFVHHQESHVLVIDVEDEVGAALIDPLGQLDAHQVVVGIISLPNVMLVD